MNKHNIWGWFILGIGVLALLQATGVVTGDIWNYIWPVAIILTGINIIISHKK